MNHDVFISYSSKNKTAADAICHVLEENHVRCWIAPRDIPPGTEYGDLIDDAIKSSVIVVLVFSQTAAVSKWVKGEINVAFEEGKIIIPFRIDTTPLKGQNRIMLNQRHWIDAYPNYENKFSDLVKAVLHSLGRNDGIGGSATVDTDINCRNKNSQWVQVNTSVGSNVASRMQVNSSAGNNTKKQINANREYFDVILAHAGNNTKKQINANANKPSRQSSGVNIKKKIKTLCNTVIAFFKTKGVVIEWSIIICFLIGIWGYIGVDWYKDSHVAQRAQGGDAGAQYKYALQFYNGDGVEQDYGKALTWFRKSAEQGNAAAQHWIGYMYDNGYGVEQDYGEALIWYRKSAEQGNANAQNNIGWMYQNGSGVEQDYAEAMKWYRKSAEQGNASAQSNIGAMYYNGYGVEQDYAEAMKWYRKSAEQGNAAAQNWIGYMYDNGYGVEQDYAEAMKWYRKSAEQDYASAQFNIGYMYYNGYGVKQDYGEALIWYRESAEQGYAAAQNWIGWLYEHGQGVEKDLRKAAEWYKKAADNGSQSALENYNRLKNKI